MFLCLLLLSSQNFDRQTGQNEEIRKMVPHLLNQEDSAPVHTANMVTKLLRSYDWKILNHPRYSPDLAPCDSYLFLKMKENLRGQSFESEEDIIVVTKGALRVLEKVTYVAAFESWLRQRHKCLDNGGDYVK